MKPGATVFTVIQRGELARPRSREGVLGALGGGVRGAARGRPVHHLGVDLHDPPEPPLSHAGQDRPPEEHRALDEELELGDVVRPRHLLEQALGLRAGGIEHEHSDRAERRLDRADHPGDRALVGDVGGERLRRAAGGWPRPPPRPPPCGR